jgi:hypothetical protein
MALPEYASVLADMFYEQQRKLNPAGTVSLSDETLKDLRVCVDVSVERRRKRLGR